MDDVAGGTNVFYSTSFAVIRVEKDVEKLTRRFEYFKYSLIMLLLFLWCLISGSLLSRVFYVYDVMSAQIEIFQVLKTRRRRLSLS